MKLGYTIIYVADVPKTVAFYEAAFGLKRRFVHESNLYAEMDTGDTVLAFAGNEAAEMNGLAISPNDPKGPRMCQPPLSARYQMAVNQSARPKKNHGDKPCLTSVI